MGGNHRYELFSEMQVLVFPKSVYQLHGLRGVKEWPCYVLASDINGVKMTAAEAEQLAGKDNGKSQYGVAKAGWFEYFEKLHRYMQFNGVVTSKSKRKVINWAAIYALSGNHEGLAENTAKKLATARKKMTKKGPLEENVLYKHMQAIHKEYGFNNPIKLKMFTEEKRFWDFEPFIQVEAINVF